MSTGLFLLGLFCLAIGIFNLALGVMTGAPFNVGVGASYVFAGGLGLGMCRPW